MRFDELRRLLAAAPQLRARAGRHSVELSCIPGPGTTETDMVRAAAAVINEAGALLDAVDAAVDCADELEAELRERHRDADSYASIQADFERDMEPVRRLRAALGITP